MENTITVTLNKERDFNQEVNDNRIKVFAELNKLLTWGEK